MARKKKEALSTLLVFVQDETGSMQERREPTISAFNEYFDTLKDDSAKFGEVTVHAWQFCDAAGEDRVRLFYKGALAEVPKLSAGNYRPRGVTPLLDAVGTALQQADAEKVDRFLFIVQTDGIENASKDFTYEQLAPMLAAKEKAENWTIVFLGAGINEWARAAARMGATFMSVSSVPATPTATRSSYDALAARSASLLASPETSHKAMGQEVEEDVRKTTPR